MRFTANGIFGVQYPLEKLIKYRETSSPGSSLQGWSAPGVLLPPAAAQTAPSHQPRLPGTSSHLSVTHAGFSWGGFQLDLPVRGRVAYPHTPLYLEVRVNPTGFSILKADQFPPPPAESRLTSRPTPGCSEPLEPVPAALAAQANSLLGSVHVWQGRSSPGTGWSFLIAKSDIFPLAWKRNLYLSARGKGCLGKGAGRGRSLPLIPLIKKKGGRKSCTAD